MSFIQYSFNSINMTAVRHYWSVPLNVRGRSLAATQKLQQDITSCTVDGDQVPVFQPAQFAINYS